MGTAMVTNHPANVSTKSNGTGNNHIPSAEKLIARRIPRLVRTANIDDHNNNLLSESYKNGMNGCTAKSNGVNGKESHLKMFNHDVQNGEMNGNSSKLMRMKNSNILKSPNFRTRVISGDE